MLFCLAFYRLADDAEQFALALAPAENRVVAEAPFVSVHFDLFDAFKGFLVDGLVVVVFAEEVAEGDFVVAVKTNFQIAVTCDAKTIAGAAEIVGHASDEADFANEAWDLESTLR